MGKLKIQKPAEMASHWKWLLFAAGACFPMAVMLFFYTGNPGYVRFDFVLVVCAIMVLISAAAWWGVYWIFRSPLSSFSVCFICWTACYASTHLIKFLQQFFPLSNNGLLCIAAIAALLSLFTALLLRGSGRNGRAAMFISGWVGVLLLINSFSSFRTAHAIRSGTYTAEQATFKTEFAVAKKGAGTPNVYWFHCDGMLGFASMKKYFGDSQGAFLQALADRGFAVNKDAMMESGRDTRIAIPALMCPDFYDHWLNTRLSSHEMAMQLRSGIFDISRLSSARINNETIHAFESAGYASHYIGAFGSFFYPTTGFVYYPSSNAGFAKLGKKGINNRLLLIDYFQLFEFLDAFAPALGVVQSYVWRIVKDETIMDPVLTKGELHNTLLSDYGIVKYSYIANALKYTLTGDMPRFTVLSSLIAHFPYYFNEDGTVIADKKNMRIMSYPAQHRYAAKVLINLIDMILREDPSAVIVLQADHGLHGNTAEEFGEYFKNTDCALDLWNNVMSAIRVPEQFRNGEESYALSNPLNMSRYIVNSFVGRNYKYISEN